MKTIKLLFFSALALYLTTGCVNEIRVKGNGIPGTEGRITQDFDKVKSSGSFDVHISAGDEYEVVISAEQNILPHIETSVSGGVLYIETKGTYNLKNQLPMEVFLTSPALKGVKLSGSGVITTDYFATELFDIALSGSGQISVAVEAERIDASISGSGKMDLSGSANEGVFNISGSGDIDSYNLAMQHCNALISGSGNMRIHVEESLHATISGSGNVYYIGNAGVETHISGSGNVIHEN